MMIAVDNLGKRFNREWIFSNFSYTFSPGAIYVITGPNGSGKSTLLQVLWGQLPPSQGSLHYRNQENHALEQTEAYIHFSMATPYMDLIEEFTLEEHIHFHFSFKTARNNWTAREIMERMELSHARTKPIKNFSSGMKQRVKLGLAFFSDTNIIFLDEPSTNLDEASFDWYRNNLEKAAFDQTIILASNQPNEYPSQSKKIEILEYK